MNNRYTSAYVQSAVDAGLTTWDQVLTMLRSDLHIPDGAIEVWRSGDRELGVVLVEWVEGVREHVFSGLRP